MSNSDHIKSFRLKNFKCFEDFTMDNIGQFNLIVGANNSGKTSLLEGLLMMEDDSHEYLYDALLRRTAVTHEQPSSKFDLLQPYLNTRLGERTVFLETISGDDFRDTYSLETCSFNEIQRQGDLSNLIQERFGKNWQNRFSGENKFLISRSKYQGNDKHDHDDIIPVVFMGDPEILAFTPLIGIHDQYRSDLVDQYSANVQLDSEIEAEFIKCLKIIVPQVEAIVIFIDGNTGAPSIGLRLKGEKSLIPLSMFGDGTVRMFFILNKLFNVVGQMWFFRRLLIDEVDFGIHNSKLREFWAMLIELAYRLNIQLFMTTHNEACVRAYWEAFESDELKEKLGINRDEVARHFIIERDKNNVPRSYCVPLSHLGHAIENDNNFMGYS